MKAMKKLVLVGLVLLASVMVLVGCDTNAGEASSANVIKVTQENFETGLQEAMVTSGSILLLESSIVIEDTILITTGDFTLDLNGKEITVLSAPGVRVDSGVTLIITDSSGKNRGAIKCSSDEYGSSAVDNTGDLTVREGILSSVSGEDSSGVNNHGNLMVSGGTISGEYGVSNQSLGNVTVSGGTVEGNLYGVINYGSFSLSRNPDITGSEASFILENFISIKDGLTGNRVYSVFWYPEVEDNKTTIVDNVSESTASNFTLIHPSWMVLKLEGSALVLAEKEGN